MVSILDKTHVNCKHLPFFVVFFTFLDWHGTLTSRGYLISPQSKFGSLSDFERLLSKDQDDLTANFTSKNTGFLKLVRMCVRIFSIFSQVLCCRLLLLLLLLLLLKPVVCACDGFLKFSPEGSGRSATRSSVLWQRFSRWHRRSGNFLLNIRFHGGSMGFHHFCS